MNKLFIFLINQDVVVPQSLEESDAGEIIHHLLQQEFYIPPVRIRAADSGKAFRQFQQLAEPKWLNQSVIQY
ncbi:hypothetical protein COO59_18710 [Mixta theicola]|uniref:Uncharacterized protein n=1 Tax=Mixta theicola TaxID=1458355 RepID=A0A2K1Q554_9GAMM|nr:hypothetical protein [Mixta theicola]PNS10185.1 hypothetical protein COO59_18710 [Mixta theicola]GLR08487.1 hypothetical protein GCM10007905_12060 [Mixta theicola]